MLGARRQTAVTHGRQDLADRTFMHFDAKASLDLIAQINPAPANDRVQRRIGASLNQRGELRPLLLGKLRRTPSADPVTQPGQTLVIVTVHPVAQGLPVHPANPGRARSVHTFENERQRLSHVVRQGFENTRLRLLRRPRVRWLRASGQSQFVAWFAPRPSRAFCIHAARNEPSFIVAPGECDELGAQLLNALKRPHPEQVFLQGSDEALGDAIALGFAHEGRRSFLATETFASRATTSNGSPRNKRATTAILRWTE